VYKLSEYLSKPVNCKNRTFIITLSAATIKSNLYGIKIYSSLYLLKEFLLHIKFRYSLQIDNSLFAISHEMP